MRLLIFGHHSHTGFGVVTEALGARFVRAGIDVRVIAVNHRGEPVRGDLAGRVWPASLSGQAYGGNISTGAITGNLWTSLDPDDEWRPDAVLVVADMSGLFGHLGGPINDAWRSVPVYHYCPIEGDRLPVGWREVWKVFAPVAMSDYGAGVISAHMGGMAVPRIYHGVDTATFAPVGAAHPLAFEGKVLRSREDCKAAFGLDPHRKILLRTDRAVERKFYHRLFEAMPAIFDADPDVDLVIHCRPVDEGQNLLEELARLPTDHWRRVHFTNAHDTWRGLPTEKLVALLNAADIYVSTTGGEGFGLTLAESLACGVPVVTSAWAAEREVVADGGVLVPPLADAYGEPVRYHSTYGMDWAVPDSRAFSAAVLDLLARPHRRRALGAAGRLHVARSFSWDDAALQFLALFEDVHAAARLAV